MSRSFDVCDDVGRKSNRDAVRGYRLFFGMGGFSNGSIKLANRADEAPERIYNILFFVLDRRKLFCFLMYDLFVLMIIA